MKTFLDNEEKEILKQFESKKLKKVMNKEVEIEKAMNIAKNTLSKTRHISIRISEKDLQSLKLRAMEAGISYQTLIGLVLHKFNEDKIKIQI